MRRPSRFAVRVLRRTYKGMLLKHVLEGLALARTWGQGRKLVEELAHRVAELAEDLEALQGAMEEAQKAAPKRKAVAAAAKKVAATQKTCPGCGKRYRDATETGHCPHGCGATVAA